MSTSTDSGFEHQVREALRSVVDPCSIATGVPISLIDMGLVTTVHVMDGRATINLCLTSPVCFQVSNIRDAVEAAVSRIEGITAVDCVVERFGDWTPDRIAPAVRAKLRALRPLSNREAGLNRNGMQTRDAQKGSEHD